MKVKYLEDKVIKKVFANENKHIRNYIARLISDTTNIPLEELKDNLELIYPEISSNINIINSISDITFKNNVKYFNIEINYSRSTTTKIKGISYTYQLTLRQLTSSKLYNKIKPITQINIDAFDILGYGDLIYETGLYVKKHQVIYSDILKIYDINLSYFQNLDYNEIEKNSLLKDLSLFVINDIDLINELCEGDKEMDMIKKELSNLTNQFDEMFYCSNEELQKQIDLEMKEIGFEEGFEEGFEDGFKEGHEEANIETAKNLLRMGKLSIEEISKVVEIPISELEKLNK